MESRKRRKLGRKSRPNHAKVVTTRRTAVGLQTFTLSDIGYDYEFHGIARLVTGAWQKSAFSPTQGAARIVAGAGLSSADSSRLAGFGYGILARR
jgi:hypothetical protein